VVSAVLTSRKCEPRKNSSRHAAARHRCSPATRVVIDEGQANDGPLLIGAGNGCMADYEASAELVTNMNKGKGPRVQGRQLAQSLISLQLPLGLWQG